MNLSRTDDVARVSTELRRNLRHLARQIEDGRLRDAVAVLTTGQDYQLGISRRKNDLILLAACSWYFSELFRSLIQIEIEEKVARNPELLQVQCLLHSEPEAICYILDSNVLGQNPNEVFGNIRASQVTIRFKRIFLRKPKKAVRHRGYRDKGTLSSESSRSRRQEWLRDYQSSLTQEQIEQERDRAITAIQITRGFCE